MPQNIEKHTIMETIEFEIIDAINKDGIDNSLWGLCRDEVNASVYDQLFDEKLPPHIYVYGDDEEIYSCELDRLLRRGYDRKLYYDPSHYVAFFWLKV